MNKDIIYIDVDDDITAVVGKIADSKEKIIALVPPKRVGILQSAVNLRLLDRMANTNNKRLVLITNNPALVALSAAAGIPVAKNLQSKPELAEISAISIDDGEDIIDGNQLPIGELEKTADTIDGEKVDDVIESLAIDEQSIPMADSDAPNKNSPTRPKSGVKVPNFNSFRKKLFIGIFAGVGLIIFLVWAALFAPSATVVITARTTPTNVSTTATLGGTAATDFAKGVIRSSSQQLKKDETVQFDATGTKNIGEKATGTVIFSNSSLTSRSIASGTEFETSGGLVFLTTSAFTVPGATFPCGNISCPVQGSASSSVIAEEGGVAYNGATGSLGGGPDGISADFDGTASGGTDKNAKVVTTDDVRRATEQLADRSTDDAKEELTALFTGGEIVIDDSFTVERKAAVSSPAVDAEASSGKATLTSATTYTMSAIARADAESYLNADLEKQLVGKDNQRVYDSGVDSISIVDFSKSANATTVRITATGRTGPRIDEAQVKDQVKGKIYGEVQSSLEAIDGIDSVDVQFSFFWVRTVPNDVNKITIEFKLQDE